MTLDSSGVTDANSPLKDIRVRQAINHAIDRSAIAQKLVGGSSHQINAACTPSQLGCTDNVQKYEFNPVKAKALLAEAGFPNGFDIDIYGYRSQPVAAAIIGYLREVGIGANFAGSNIPPLSRRGVNGRRRSL